jgi:hypothetical protein
MGPVIFHLLTVHYGCIQETSWAACGFLSQQLIFCLQTFLLNIRHASSNTEPLTTYSTFLCSFIWQCWHGTFYKNYWQHICDTCTMEKYCKWTHPTEQKIILRCIGLLCMRHLTQLAKRINLQCRWDWYYSYYTACSSLSLVRQEMLQHLTHKSNFAYSRLVTLRQIQNPTGHLWLQHAVSRSLVFIHL